MSDSWFYSRDGKTNGPFTTAQMKDRAARKILLPGDWVWQEGTPRPDGALAETVFGSAPAPTPAPMPAPSLPDWLADVDDGAVVEAKGPYIAAPAPAPESPAWLEDLRLWVGLELYVPPKPAPSEPLEIAFSAPVQTPAVPDWLESFRTSEPPKAPQPTPPVSAPAAPPPVVKPAPVLPPLQRPAASTTLAPVATPTALAKPITPPPTALAPLATPVSPATMLPTASAAPPLATILATPAPAAPPAPVQATPAAPAPTLAEKLRDESGFDVNSGQILDPVKFQQWKQQQARTTLAGPAVVSNASLFEVFRKGRTAIEAWIDDEKNRPCIVHAEMHEIKKHPNVLAIVHQYASYGKDIQDKLLRHLEFMVENRKKYHAALKGQ